MSNQIAFKATHKEFPVKVGIVVRWDEGATNEQIAETITLGYATAMKKLDEKA
ncbi:hypothetical protein [Mycolicibacterium palauense]|uniref:hypothetical protein n=1 Tax=Mycolicibacterium palauense TaxID=2034511 RepID=UPI00159BB91F|nr:hypothetical protein [Mycolicibacterium palauense]